MKGAALVAIAATIGNFLQGWDNATIAGTSLCRSLPICFKKLYTLVTLLSVHFSVIYTLMSFECTIMYYWTSKDLYQLVSKL